MIYLDNASTSFPKPRAVLDAVVSSVRDSAANPGRGGYLSARSADRLVYETRNMAGDLFGAQDNARVIFTPGCTYSLNVALRGLVTSADHVVAGGRQHNAVVRTLEDIGCAVSHYRWDGNGPFIWEDLHKLITPQTKAVVINHASNVDGLLYPLDAVREACKGVVPLILDCAQTAGLADLRLGDSEVFCAPAHKGLLGVAGTGILAFGKGVELGPLVSGGTGSFSEDAGMPPKYPDRLEPGSVNLVGISALNAGLGEVRKAGPKKIFEKKMALALSAFDGLLKISGAKIFWPKHAQERVPVFSFLLGGMDPAEIATLLDHDYGIACRAGLHCAPEAHKELGTFPYGAVRFAPGFYTTPGEVSDFIKAVREIAKR